MKLNLKAQCVTFQVLCKLFLDKTQSSPCVFIAAAVSKMKVLPHLIVKNIHLLSVFFFPSVFTRSKRRARV